MTDREMPTLFDNVKYCTECRRILHKEYKGDLCSGCIDRQLFSKVKEYIRANDVTEYDVSVHFSIPISKVKSWIREGRIEYRDLNLKTLPNIHCQKCGASITFGTLCTKCMRLTGMKGSSNDIPRGEDGHLRHISKNDRKI